MKQAGLIQRFVDLWRGFWRLKLQTTESNNPQLVYAQSIAQHRAQIESLKKNASALILLRNKNLSRHHENREHLGLLEIEIELSILNDSDENTLKLLQQKHALKERGEQLCKENHRYEDQITLLKSNIITLTSQVIDLEKERDEMSARKAQAESTLRLNQVMHGTKNFNAENQGALQNIRDAILKLESEAELTPSQNETSTTSSSLNKLRSDASIRQAESELHHLKQHLKRRLLPRPKLHNNVPNPLHVSIEGR